MYATGGKDKLVEDTQVPCADIGAPNPLVLVNDRSCVLAYEVNPDEEWAIVVFSGRTIYFGPPNDEALSGHPLYDKGLRSYRAYEVTNSSWIELLETRNRVHARHDPARHARLRHFIWTFHDSTFEIVAQQLTWQSWTGRSADLIGEMGRRLR